MKTNLESSLEASLNLPVITPEIMPPVRAKPVDVISNDSEAESDFQSARTNIKTIIDQGQEALSGILDLASASEHPRTFEVAGQLIKTLVDANKDLLGLHKLAKELKSGDKQEEPGTVTNNAYFVGSTSELQQLINKRKVVSNE